MTPSGALPTIQRWSPVALWCLAILGASSIPGSSLGRVGFDPPDKLIHAIEYAGLGFLALRQQLGERSISRRRAVITALLLAVSVGALDETYQRLVPQRTPSWGDLLADAVGGSVGVFLAHLRYARRAPRRWF